ncbi:MAG TPA: S24/S26 family peptidase [Methanobacteriaceae archaeon]|nr:S24/S26 family peptidase [Methanobacteriaceae archaeon]
MIYLRSRTWLIVGILVLLLLVGTAYWATSSTSVKIVVETNGTDVTVKGSTQPLPLGNVPEDMITQMKDKALEDVQDETSTVESIKVDMENIAKSHGYTAQVTLISQFGENQLPMPATVRGTSMIPTLQDNQDIIVLKTDKFQVNDLVVAVHPEYGLIVKRVAQIDGDQVYLKSDNRQTEIIGTETRMVNGMEEVVTIEKTPLDAWLPKKNVVGVVKVY